MTNATRPNLLTTIFYRGFHNFVALGAPPEGEQDILRWVEANIATFDKPGLTMETLRCVVTMRPVKGYPCRVFFWRKGWLERKGKELIPVFPVVRTRTRGEKPVDKDSVAS